MLEDNPARPSSLKNENISFINKLMFQFLMHNKNMDESSNVYQKLHKLVVMMLEFKKQKN